MFYSMGPGCGAREFRTAAANPDAPIPTPSDVYRVAALIAEVLQSMVRDTTTASLLAARSRLSGSHFAALLKSRIGYPAVQYQTQLRMARARELLDATDQSIAEVAAATGYPTASISPASSRRCTG